MRLFSAEAYLIVLVACMLVLIGMVSGCGKNEDPAIYGPQACESLMTPSQYLACMSRATSPAYTGRQP